MREIGPRLQQRATARSPTEIDLKAAGAQHSRFGDLLKQLGATVVYVASLPEVADAFRVEESAIVLPEVAIIARLAGATRQSEIESVASALAEYRPVMRLVAPATFAGSDVLRIGHKLFVGRSAQTNPEGIAALAETVEPFGYEVQAVDLRDCPRLKAACTFIPPQFLVANPAWVDVRTFGGLGVIPVDEHEAFAANTFTVNGTTIVSSAFPKTEQRLRENGITTRKIDVSEFQKADAGLSSLCLLLEPRATRANESTVPMRFVNTSNSRAATECFSPAIVHGGLVYVSGQLPLDPLTGRVVDGSIDEQTEQVLHNLSEVLFASGSSLPHVLKLTFFVADLALKDRVKEACTRIMGGHRPAGFFVPTKTLEGGCLVAVDAIAAVEE